MRTRSTVITLLWAAGMALMAGGLLLLAASGFASIPDGAPVTPAILFSVVVVVTSFSTVGLVVATRNPDNRIGWLFLFAGIGHGLQTITISYVIASVTGAASLPATAQVAWLAVLFQAANPAFVFLLLLLFPDGNFQSAWARRFAGVALFAAAVGLPLYMSRPGPLQNFPPIDNPFPLVGNLWPAAESIGAIILAIAPGIFLGAVVAFLLRLRSARGVERQQLKLFAFAGLLASPVVTWIGSVVARQQSFTGTFDLATISAIYLLTVAALPIAAGVAILRYGLYGIDRLINRTLVYLGLSGAVVAIWLVIVVGTGAVLFGDLGASLLAVVVVTLLFNPLRTRLQRAVDRLFYGDRRDPYRVIAGLGERLQSTLVPAEVLPAIVNTLPTSLNVSYAAITWSLPSGERQTVAAGTPTDQAERIPLVYQAEQLGELLIALPQGGSFSAVELHLLTDLASQIAVAVHAVRLTGDLQQSRERIVVAREEERRTLRRDLHDGLGPTLASLTLRLEAARDRAEDEETRALLAELAERSRRTVTDIRRVIYGLRPPALDDLGLVSAIREAAAQHGPADGNGLSVEVDAPDKLPDLPAAVETAAYHICVEAMTNVARHAVANRCSVRLSVDAKGRVLRLEIDDDGVGLDEQRTFGVGLRSMRERAEELGGQLSVQSRSSGGTLVVASLPLRGMSQSPGTTSSPSGYSTNDPTAELAPIEACDARRRRDPGADCRRQRRLSRRPAGHPRAGQGCRDRGRRAGGPAGSRNGRTAATGRDIDGPTDAGLERH